MKIFLVGLATIEPPSITLKMHRPAIFRPQADFFIAFSRSASQRSAGQTSGVSPWSPTSDLFWLPLLREQRTAVYRAVAQNLFDPEQLVVFRHTVGTRGRAGLDLAGAQCNRQVGNGRIFGLAAAVARNRRVAVPLGQLDRFDRLGQCADLVDLDQNAVGDLFVDAALEPLRVGNEEVVADQLNLLAELFSQHLPSLPNRLPHSRLRSKRSGTYRPNSRADRPSGRN